MTTESRVRTAIVGVRCTPAEHADIRLAAAARGMSVSSYLRGLHERATAETEDHEPPELWWHRDHGVMLPTVADGVDYGWHVLGSATWLDERPRDAVRLTALPLGQPS